MPFEDKLQQLVDSYGLPHLLEEYDLTEEHVLRLLVTRGDITLSDFFPDEEGEE